MSPLDTIAALITGGGPAAVAIVRLAGPEAFAIARQVCGRWPEALEPRRAFQSTFQRDGHPFDAGLVLPFRGPASYTGDDVVELQGHGGHAARVLLEAVLAAGARLAEPGEFTRRAYLAGKLDAAQAEAVALLIGAETDRALRAAQGLLGGALSREVQELEESLGVLRGRVEGLLEFPQEAEGAEEGLAKAISAVADRIARLHATFARGRRLFSRATVVIAGPVNAGKSSLLNGLAGEERALVDAEPGTTRDLVTVDLELEGFAVRLVDTAGRRAASGVEARGIAMGEAAARDADLTLWVVDGARPQPPPDPAWLRVWNKCDLAPEVPEGWLAVSATTGAGLGALGVEIARRLAPAQGEEQLVVGTVRQAVALGEAEQALRRAGEHGMLELVAEDLRTAAGALARVRGLGLEDRVMDEVFAQFCIGK